MKTTLKSIEEIKEEINKLNNRIEKLESEKYNIFYQDTFCKYTFIEKNDGIELDYLNSLKGKDLIDSIKIKDAVFNADVVAVLDFNNKYTAPIEIFKSCNIYLNSSRLSLCDHKRLESKHTTMFLGIFFYISKEKRNLRFEDYKILGISKPLNISVVYIKQ